MSETRLRTPRSHGDAAAGADAGHPAGLAHIMPMRVLVTVWLSLVVLTWITVAVTHFDMGRAALWVAMIIATIKGSLVVLYFMHLRYDRPINAVIFIGSLIFVTLFVGTVLLDTRAYQPTIIQGYAPAMQSSQPTQTP